PPVEQQGQKGTHKLIVVGAAGLGEIVPRGGFIARINEGLGVGSSALIPIAAHAGGCGLEFGVLHAGIISRFARRLERPPEYSRVRSCLHGTRIRKWALRPCASPFPR